MPQRKWAYKPGEATDSQKIKPDASLQMLMSDKFLDLTDEYTNYVDAKRTLVLDDNKEVVFFVQLDDTFTMTKQLDVFVWNGHDYISMPQKFSDTISKHYFDYLDAMSDAYDYMQKEASYNENH